MSEGRLHANIERELSQIPIMAKTHADPENKKVSPTLKREIRIMILEYKRAKSAHSKL